MLIIQLFQVFMPFSEVVPVKIARKDTAIFSNRCYFIEKLTLARSKKSVSRC